MHVIGHIKIDKIHGEKSHCIDERSYMQVIRQIKISRTRIKSGIV